jgi:hypothetical protein
MGRANTPHGSRGKAYDKVCGFQLQRELTTRGLVILRILRILREIKNEDDDEDDNSPLIRSPFTVYRSSVHPFPKTAVLRRSGGRSRD